MTTPITVVIPVGPEPKDCAYFEECMASVAAQTVAASEVVIVDDMNGLSLYPDLARIGPTPMKLYRNPWLMGVAASFNVGVALAPTEHVLLLGSDDWLEPNAIELAQETIERNRIEQAYFWYRIRYADDRPDPDQGLPCGAAVVTKKLWRATGGFAPELGVGASDAAMVSLLWVHPIAGTCVEIRDEGRPPYNVRTGPHQHTATRGPWQGIILETRRVFYETWEPPRWGRYE